MPHFLTNNFYTPKKHLLCVNSSQNSEKWRKSVHSSCVWVLLPLILKSEIILRTKNQKFYALKFLNSFLKKSKSTARKEIFSHLKINNNVHIHLKVLANSFLKLKKYLHFKVYF